MLGSSLADCHDDIELAQQVETTLVIFIWDVETGTIVIDIIAAAVTNPALDIVQSTHGDHTISYIGMA